MLAYDARPPDPHYVGDGWREQWLERLEAMEPSVERWLTHQRRDAYWQQGSVCEDFAAITCPVYAVGGWADAYTDAVFRLLEHLTCPRKGMIGSWAHNFPEEGLPGPAIGFLQESLRWWDWCLKGEETGIMDGPDLSVWVQDGEPFHKYGQTFPGSWYDVDWPAPHEAAVYHPSSASGERTLEERASSGTEVARTDHDVGSLMGNWCSYGVIDDFAEDQAFDDERSLTYDASPQESPMVVLGFPVLHLRLSADASPALVAARLCDVAPDGTSSLVSWGFLNLTHRESHEHPSAIVPGEWLDIQLKLMGIAYRIREGHRWRLSVSTTCWPFAWPSPTAPTLRFDLWACRLELPTGQTLTPREFPVAQVSEPIERVTLSESTREREVSRAETIETRSSTDTGTFRLDGGLEYAERAEDICRIAPDDPLSAETISTREIDIRREAWNIGVRVWSRMTSDEENFHVENELLVTEDSRTLFERSWNRSIPRDHG